jgi:putative FmdB family regulatory protein
MPLYEYECQSCHRRIEKIKTSFSAAPETVCPHCGGKLEQTLSAPAVQFKGAGFYVTDYKGNSAAAKPASGSAETSGSSDKPASSTADAAKPASAPAKTESAATPSSSSAKSD